MGSDLGSSLFASSTIFYFVTILPKINFQKLEKTDCSWWPFCIPDCNGLEKADNWNLTLWKLFVFSYLFFVLSEFAKIHNFHLKCCFNTPACTCGLNVKQFVSQTKPHYWWGFIWIQIVWKGHQWYSKSIANWQRVNWVFLIFFRNSKEWRTHEKNIKQVLTVYRH